MLPNNLLNNGQLNSTPLLPNPLYPTGNMNIRNTLSLNQIEGFKPVTEFTDETNTTWNLVKSSSDATVDIPDPKSMQFLDCWNHAFPGIKTKLYVYVVEGVRLPRVETEQPTRILYQWFSNVFAPNFNPSMITEREWLKANVYAAPVINARVSKLKAICHITEESSMPVVKEEDKLLQIDELKHEDTQRNTE